MSSVFSFSNKKLNFHSVLKKMFSLAYYTWLVFYGIIDCFSIYAGMFTLLVTLHFPNFIEFFMQQACFLCLMKSWIFISFWKFSSFYFEKQNPDKTFPCAYYKCLLLYMPLYTLLKLYAKISPFKIPRLFIILPNEFLKDKHVFFLE